MSATLTKPMTADELLAMPDDGYRYELVEGELRRMSPAGDEHGLVGMELAIPLGSHVKKNGLGKLYLAETGFLIKTNPDTVRAPDIAFVRMERIKETPGIKGYRVGAPDLAVEVIESSCCGMAGNFGYEANHYDVSMKMAEASLLPTIRAAAADTIIVADGTSCRHQIHDGAQRDAVHVARVLEQALV